MIEAASVLFQLPLVSTSLSPSSRRRPEGTDVRRDPTGMRREWGERETDAS